VQKELNLAVFVEQAEYINHSDFNRWVVEHPREEAIIKKLISPGAKLITGPRGCGKTTLLLKSLYEAPEKNVLAIYVNFKTSLKMEPLYRKNANAPYWFIQWMLLKVYDGLFESLEITNTEDSSKYLSVTRPEIKKTIRLIEDGLVERVLDKNTVSIDILQHELDEITRINDFSRCVLLLDDAAHAFSPEQQEDFFDFFRKIKSRNISPKAAIYPGVTAFSPSFHVGHDAEEISAWLNPAKDNYQNFMWSLLQNRLPEHVFEKLMAEETLLKLLIYAANGIPRYLLNMVNAIVFGDDGDDGDNTKELKEIKINRKAVLQAIEENSNNVKDVYTSLKFKLPIYKEFIDNGTRFFDRVIEILKEYNKGGEIDRQSTIIAIKTPIEAEVSKVLGFLEYAGLLCPVGDSKRGSKGVYDLFALSNSVIIERNVFFSARSINSQNYVAAFEGRPGHIYPRVTTETIFNSKEISSLFELSLPPCQKCKTPRINEDAKFCINCGSELTSVSIFEGIVNQDISVLPLTPNRIAAIKKNSKIRKIKDILMDHDRRQLRSVPMIGRIWAKRIANYAEEQFA
jgi:ABC-type iron transport system FetAB ATPase subunit